MPLRFLKRLSPRRRDLTERWFLRPFGAVLHDPALWRLDRHGASRALALGLFIGWLPIPLQMVVAALLALVIRVHLPLAVVAVWISNPLTTVPMLYFAYRLGLVLMGLEPSGFAFETDLGWILREIHRIWQPMLLGSIVAGVFTAVLGYVLLDVLWYWTLVRKYRRIQAAKLRRTAAPSSVDE